TTNNTDDVVSLVYAGNNTYTVSMEVVTANGCNISVTKNQHIAVTEADLIITPDTTICFGTSKQLRTHPSLRFCWTPDSFLNGINLPNPETSPEDNITYYFTAEVTGT